MALFFLHGLGQGPDSWQKVVGHLPGSLESRCLDLAAWVQDGAETYEQLYKRMWEVLQGEPGRVSLCGLSLGGVLALQYAGEHPDQVEKLILIGTPCPIPRGLLRIQNLLFRCLPEAAFSGGGMGKRKMLVLSRSMEQLELVPWAEQISCPTLVLCGERDRTNRRSAHTLSQKISQARFQELPGAGHLANLDAPERLAQALAAFLIQQSR